MQKINIVCIGKMNKVHINIWQQELITTLSKYFDVNLVELPKSDNKDKVQRQRQEYLSLSRWIKSENVNILLDVDGKKFDSETFSKELIEENANYGKTLTFFIPGPFGISQKNKDNFDRRISLSDMTFTHQIVRILLLEQIYRAYTIMKGISYHY